MSIEDVTTRVNSSVKPGLSPEAASKARDSAIAEIEKESKEKTGLRSDVVKLYQGGAYHLYRYKRYDDVRIVFAPEQQMAFYGGDPDNFEYPRFDFDICIFRVYENGQPAKIRDYLKWNSHGPSESELIFVSGSPGRTDRQLTVDELTDHPELVATHARRHRTFQGLSEDGVGRAQGLGRDCRWIDASGPYQPRILLALPLLQGFERVVEQLVVTSARDAVDGGLIGVPIEITLEILVGQRANALVRRGRSRGRRLSIASAEDEGNQ